MGMRHEAYLIARVRPKHGEPAYRCIAAFHHQWCWGMSAVMNGKFQRDRDCKDDNYRMPEVPCPYSLSLLATAWTTNLDERFGRPHFTGNTLWFDALDANIKSCWGCLNSEAISIIDISDPLNPAYCFMVSTSPMSAYEYLSTCYDLEGVDDIYQINTFLAIITYISGIPLLRSDILKEAWPHDTFNTRPEQDHVVVPHDHVRSLSNPDYTLRVWDTAVQHLLADPDDDEPRQWYASFGPSGLPDSDVAYSKLNTYLLRHPAALNFQFVTVPMPSDYYIPLLALLPNLDVSSASDEQLTTIRAAKEHIGAALRQLSPFPDDRLDCLVKLTTLAGDHFAELSGYDLSPAQIIRFLGQCPDLDSLDISQNPHVTLSDIPAILTAAPCLLRLNVYGCRAIDGEELLDLLRKQPPLFRTIEAIIHTVFLTIEKPSEYPIAFTYICANAASFDESNTSGASIPLFTPTQVLQALCRLLPPAWNSVDGHHVTVGAARTKETGRWRFPFPEYTSLNQPGNLTDSSPMLAYGALSGGSRRPGASWSDRAVISMPLHPYPAASPSPEGSWAFFLDSSRVKYALPGESSDMTWAFIHYAPDEEQTSIEPSLDGDGEDGEDEDNEDEQSEGLMLEDVTRRGKAYYLRGFLRCMVEEGRPPPPPELVAELEELLQRRREFDGRLVCPLMRDEDMPTALTWIPVTPDQGPSNILDWWARTTEAHPPLNPITRLMVMLQYTA